AGGKDSTTIDGATCPLDQEILRRWRRRCDTSRTIGCEVHLERTCAASPSMYFLFISRELLMRLSATLAAILATVVIHLSAQVAGVLPIFVDYAAPPDRLDGLVAFADAVALFRVEGIRFESSTDNVTGRTATLLVMICVCWT